MIRRLRPFSVWLAAAVATLAAVGAFAILLAVMQPADGPGTAVAPSATAPVIVSGGTWPMSLRPGEVQMPDGADCAACHVTAGGVIGVKAVPAIAHPVHGWTNCTACHSNETLVATAPGHSGIHADQCVVCHQQASGPAPSPRHPSLPDMDCLACHGTIAPLPSSMADRPQTLCWLCHHE